MGFLSRSKPAPQSPAPPARTAAMTPTFQPTRLFHFALEASSHTVDSRVFDLGAELHAARGNSRSNGGSSGNDSTRTSSVTATSTSATPRDAQPWLEVRKNKWYSKTFAVLESAGSGGSGSSNELARWVPGWSSSTTNELRFSSSSAGGEAVVKVKTDGRWHFRERFVLGARGREVVYSWVGEDWWGGNRTLKLVRATPDGGDEIVVGSFSRAGERGSGTIAVDDRGIDALVAVLTCVVALKKERQRQSEGRNG